MPHAPASLILSDTGGVQEEVPSLGVPLSVLREKTERPEAMASGNVRLVGTASNDIVTATRRLLLDPDAYAAMARCPALRHGRAGERIAAAIED